MYGILSFVAILIAGVVGVLLGGRINMVELGVIFAIAAAGACIVGAVKSKK